MTSVAIGALRDEIVLEPRFTLGKFLCSLETITHFEPTSTLCSGELTLRWANKREVAVF